MTAKTICILNNKGGVGKTTSIIFLSEILSLFGKKVLIVDGDESGNLSYVFGKYQEDSKAVLNGIESAPQNNLTEIFRYKYRTEEEVMKSIYNVRKNLDILPASKRLNMIPDFLLLQSRTSSSNNNIILTRALASVSHKYDYILIDTSPKNDIFIVNNLMASDYVLIPVRSEGLSFKGLKEILSELADLKEEYDIRAELLGAYQIGTEQNTTIYSSLNQAYNEMFGKKNLPSIRKDVKVNEILTTSIVAEGDLIKYTASSNILYDYCMLLLSLNILDPDTENLIRRAYNLVQ